MALLKVQALKYVTIIDPFPMEGVGHVTIQQSPGTYKAYRVYDHQADRLTAYLDKAESELILTYSIEWDDTAVLNAKRTASITWTDVTPSNKILLGVIPAGTTASEVIIKVTGAFDDNTTFSVGDATAQALLMREPDSNPDVAGSYKVDCDTLFTDEAELYLYMQSGNPTTGAAEVTVYIA